MEFRSAVGAYGVDDLQAMDADELEELRRFAIDRFNEHLEHHIMTGGPVPPPDCRRCAYFQTLVGAAEDELAKRRR